MAKCDHTWKYILTRNVESTQMRTKFYKCKKCKAVQTDEIGKMPKYTSKKSVFRANSMSCGYTKPREVDKKTEKMIIFGRDGCKVTRHGPSSCPRRYTIFNSATREMKDIEKDEWWKLSDLRDYFREDSILTN